VSRPGVRDERGTALIEVTWLSILLLVPLVYVVISAFEVQRAAFALDAATRAAGRAYTLAPSQGEAADRARRAARVALADQGLLLPDGAMSVTCSPVPDSCLSSGSVVHVRMAYQVNLPLVPDALGTNVPSVRVAADQAVPYGTFRQARP
jgi:Flp pilus assembly protein TadG